MFMPNKFSPLHLDLVWERVWNRLFSKFIFFAKKYYFFIFLDRFDVLILKIIFKI